MNEIEMINLLGKLQDIRDDIYILGNVKTAKTNLENIIKELNLKIEEIKVNGIDNSQDKALHKHCVNGSAYFVDTEKGAICVIAENIYGVFEKCHKAGYKKVEMIKAASFDILE